TRVAALLMADDHDCAPIEARHAADHGRIIAKAPVAVHLDKLFAATTHIVERVRALRVTRELDFVPRSDSCGHIQCITIRMSNWGLGGISSAPSSQSPVPDLRRSP